jgi:hypothetical protein
MHPLGFSYQHHSMANACSYHQSYSDQLEETSEKA